MNQGDRVRDKRGLDDVVTLGTVSAVTGHGTVCVHWDHLTQQVVGERFHPDDLPHALEVVTGDEAKRRHVWNEARFDDETVCEHCELPQTDDNKNAPCEAQS